MNIQEAAALLLVMVLLAGVVMTSGCTQRGSQDNQTTEPPGPPAPPEEPEGTPNISVSSYSCAQLNGHACSTEEDCGGKWLDASDTFSCCSAACTSAVGDVLEIETFDVSPENEGMGDVV